MIARYIKRIEERSQKLRRMQKSTLAAQKALFIFKSFGDAIAFLYISRFNLKQLSFDLENERLKNNAGFITGKKGFQNELDQVKKYLDMGYPGLLCDLTNSIRYGDILMLFQDSDPIIIECKLARQNDQRSRRQAGRLKKLAEYYALSKKTIKKGIVPVSRAYTQLPLVEYSNKMNQLIKTAREHGTASEEVERGLHYIASFDSLMLEDKFRALNLADPWITILNIQLTDQNWISYYPFTLSVNKSEDLVDFVLGRLVLAVIVELKTISRILPKEKARFVLNEGSEHPFEFFLYEKGAKSATSCFAISAHMLRRVPLEFVSMQWVIKNSYQMWTADLQLC